mmetsp:Transcript_24737/g.62206  ORF Transcript_24737/g.62206 Transcript_24737/m.62206 type:complete len:274 (+) Transcript_24737:674-1495(+)
MKQLAPFRLLRRSRNLGPLHRLRVLRTKCLRCTLRSGTFLVARIPMGVDQWQSHLGAQIICVINDVHVIVFPLLYSLDPKLHKFSAIAIDCLVKSQQVQPFPSHRIRTRSLQPHKGSLAGVGVANHDKNRKFSHFIKADLFPTLKSRMSDKVFDSCNCAVKCVLCILSKKLPPCGVHYIFVLAVELHKPRCHHLRVAVIPWKAVLEDCVKLPAFAGVLQISQLLLCDAVVLAKTFRRAISKFKFCFRRQSPRPKQAHFYQLMKDGIILQEAFS